MLKFLSSSVPISRSFFLIPRFAGRLVGCWPQERRSWLTVGIFWVNCFFITFGACGENLYGIIYYADLQSALEAFCPGITMAVCILKMTLFFLYPHSFLRTILRLKCLLTIDGCEEKSKIIQRLASIGSVLSFLLFFSGTATTFFFSFSPLVTSAYSFWEGKEFSLQLPFNIILPLKFKQMPFYPLTYVLLTLSACTTSSTFSTVDGFFVCACMYMTAEFEMLQHDVRQLFAELHTREYATETQNTKFHRELSDIVVRHNAIIDLCSDFTTQFTVIILMHFLSAAIVLCLSILNLMLTFGTVNMLTYIFYSLAALTQLFLYCIGGNFVSESSQEVATTLYDIEWYKCDVRTKKMILMMLRRSQKAITITVPFFTPSLPAFSSILSTAGSYITLLQTFL